MAYIFIEIICACNIPMKNAITTVDSGKVNLFNNGEFYSGFLILPALVVLVFSYNYHAIWLVYDVIAIILLFHYATSRQKKISSFQGYFLILVLGYFLTLTLISENWFLAILSVWDTFKHLLYFPVIITISQLNIYGHNLKLANMTYKFIGFIFFIQVIVVGIQYNIGVHFDDVAGTFGDGGSHAIAYISLLFITACFAFHKKNIFIIGSIGVAVLMNIASENAGFFVLLSILMLCILIAKKTYIKFLFIVGVLVVPIYFLLEIPLYSEMAFGEVIVSRAIGIFEIPDYFDPSETHGRGSYLFLASYLGGWFGHGPGAFSSIYLMQGYDLENLIDQQINITEVSHLIAESGFVGLFLTIVIYILFIVNFFDTLGMKVFMALFFVACMLYSALLMNESHIFILLLIFYFFKMIEGSSSGKASNLRLSRRGGRVYRKLLL